MFRMSLAVMLVEQIWIDLSMPARIGPTTVASLSRNAWGLYDMSGNVNEWVWDYWALPAESPMGLRDPVGPAEGFQRVHRGGSWHGTERGVRVFYRAFHPPDRSNTRYGVRLVRSLGPQRE